MIAKQRAGTLWLAATLATAIVLSIFPVHGLLGSDIFWHLKTGDYIIQNLRLPTHDLFTYTVPPETRWHDTQWLFQIIASLAFHAGAWNGLIALRAVCVAALAFVLWGWLRERGHSAVISFLSIAAILIGSHTRFQTRPELFGYILLALTMRLHDRASRNGRVNLAKAIIIQVLWANTHASCVLGIAIAGVFALERWFDSRPRKMSNLVLVPALLVAATLANPNGWTMLTYALTEGGKSSISELKAPGWNLFSMGGFFVMLLSAPGFLLLLRKGQRSCPAIAAAFSIQALRMVRFMPFLLVAASPLTAEGWRAWLNFPEGSRVFRACRVGLVAVLASLAAFFGLHNANLFHLGLDDSMSPAAAADFVKSAGLAGRLFNISTDGSYLLWRLGPERKVFAFNETRLCSDFILLPPSPALASQWRRLFDTWNISYAIIPCDEKGFYAELKTVGEIIDAWPDWKLAFWDDRYMVFVRDSADNKDLIRRRESLVFPEQIPFADSPVANAEPLQQMAANPATRDRLKAELERAHSESPQHFRAALGLGLWYETNGSPLKALEYYHEAEGMFPRSASLLVCLGRWYFTNGQPEVGLKYLKRAASVAPDNPSILYNLALAQSRSGNVEQAAKTLNTILRIDPKFAPALNLQKSVTSPVNKP